MKSYFKYQILLPALLVGFNTMLAPAGKAQTFTNLYSFTGTNDGGTPNGGLIQGKDGNLYGTTGYGGKQDGGTAFRISTGGALTILYSFNDGEYFGSPLAQGTDGGFYGTSGFINGTAGGKVFKISSNGVLTVLHSFSGSDGASPNYGVMQGRDGNFYGTTEVVQSGFTGGTIYKISINGSYSVLHQFNDQAYSGPVGGLVQGTDGNLYGATYGDGNNSFGTVFKISTNGVFNVLHLFDGSIEGYSPESGLIEGKDGYFYGATPFGPFPKSGPLGYGTIYKMSTNGMFTTIHVFDSLDGWQPNVALLQGSDGDFYGTTSIGNTNAGFIFKISSEGNFAPLHEFSIAGGGFTQSLVQGRDGILYGSTPSGGSHSQGSIFALALPSPPLLAISLSPSNASLSWPTNSTAYPFKLQSTANLGTSATWTTIALAPVVVSGQNRVTNAITGGHIFYRLSQ
jgi:uncharacterized repeat protein (TIGR03803 family)